MGSLSAPARPRRTKDSECALANNLVAQRRVGRVEPPAAGVAEQPLQLVALRHPRAPGDIERPINDTESTLDAMVLRRDELHRPGQAVVDAIRPLLGDSVGVRYHALEIDCHFSHGVLDLGVVRHWAVHLSDSALALNR